MRPRRISSRKPRRARLARMVADDEGVSAQSVVVLEEKFVDDSDRRSAATGQEDLSGKDHTATSTLEGKRTDTDDVLPGPDVGKGEPAKGRRGTKRRPRNRRRSEHASGQGPDLHQHLRPSGQEPERRDEARPFRRHRRYHRQGPRLDHQRDEGLGPARSRWRRLPDRPEVVVHAKEVGERPHYLVVNADESEPGPARTGKSCATTRSRWSRAA